jgi:hypothetical protein
MWESNPPDFRIASAMTTPCSPIAHIFNKPLIDRIEPPTLYTGIIQIYLKAATCCGLYRIRTDLFFLSDSQVATPSSPIVHI